MQHARLLSGNTVTWCRYRNTVKISAQQRLLKVFIVWWRHLRHVINDLSDGSKIDSWQLRSTEGKQVALLAASCLLVVNFNSTKRPAHSSIVTYFRIKLYSVLFVVVIHAGCDKQDSLMRGGQCGKLHGRPSHCCSHCSSHRSMARYLSRIAICAYQTCIWRPR